MVRWRSRQPSKNRVPACMTMIMTMLTDTETSLPTSLIVTTLIS